MAWRSRNALLVLAAAIVVLLLVQTNVARLLLGPFLGTPLHENVMTLTHRKTYNAESMLAGSLSSEVPLRDADDSQQVGVDGIFDVQGQSVDADQSLTAKYDFGETSDERSDAAQQANDAPDVDYDYAVVDDTAFPTQTEQSAAKMPAFKFDWVFGKAATAIGNGQDSTEGEIGSDVNGATQPSKAPTEKVKAQLTSTAKPMAQIKNKQSQSGNTYALSKRPAEVFVFSGTDDNAGDQSKSGHNEKIAQHNDQKFNSNQQTTPSPPWSKLVSEITPVTYKGTASASRIAVTDNSRRAGAKQSSLIESALPTPADQASPAGFGDQLSSAMRRQDASITNSPESNSFVSSVRQATDFATVASRNSDGDHSTYISAASSLTSSLPVVLITQGKNSSRALSHVIFSSNSKVPNKGKISSRPTLTSTNVASATGVDEARSLMYDSDVTSSTYTSATNQSSSVVTIAGERSIQRILTATAAPGSLVTGTSSEQSQLPVNLWSSSEQRPAVSLAISTAPAASSNLFTVSRSRLSMGMTRFSEKLFLVSAYSDFRKSPPTVKIVVFAHRDFDEAVSCVHSKLVRSARLSWINYVTKERALWRAGYMECEVPAITTSAEPRIELQSSSAAPGPPA